MTLETRVFLTIIAVTTALLWDGPMLAYGQTKSQSQQTSPGQNSSSPVVAVIDVQSMLREAKAAKDIRAQIEERRSAYQEEISKQEKELRQADEALARQRAVLSSDAFQEKRAQLERRVAEVQRNVEQRRRQLDQAFGEAMREVQVALIKIVEEIATQRNIDIVLAKSQVVLVSRDLEITDEALRRLDERLPSVELPATTDAAN